MNVQFFDRQDTHNPHNGATVCNYQTVLDWLDETISRPPFFCELLGENGYKLLVGISGTRGCAQYSASDGRPPYLMATMSTAAIKEGYMEFLTANTDTPVPLRFCLPMQMIREAVAEFVRTGERSSAFDWEEI